MKKIFFIVGIVIALSNVIYSFFGMNDTAKLFGFDINIWMYRLIWLFLAVLMFKAYKKESKKTVN